MRAIRRTSIDLAQCKIHGELVVSCRASSTRLRTDMIRDKIVDRSGSANADHVLFRIEDPPICMRDAAATLLSAELDKLGEFQEQLEFFENEIAKGRARLICLRARFYDAGLDAGLRMQAGEQLLRIMNRLQQTLEKSCSLRRPGEP